MIRGIFNSLPEPGTYELTIQQRGVAHIELTASDIKELEQEQYLLPREVTTKAFGQEYVVSLWITLSPGWRTK